MRVKWLKTKDEIFEDCEIEVSGNYVFVRGELKHKILRKTDIVSYIYKPPLYLG